MSLVILELAECAFIIAEWASRLFLNHIPVRTPVMSPAPFCESRDCAMTAQMKKLQTDHFYFTFFFVRDLRTAIEKKKGPNVCVCVRCVCVCVCVCARARCLYFEYLKSSWCISTTHSEILQQRTHPVARSRAIHILIYIYIYMVYIIYI